MRRMSAGQADAILWWFCSRQVSPRPPGDWLTRGPFGTHDEAIVAWAAAKKRWDTTVGNIFSATAAEAQEDCAAGRTR